jgi:hypothetical protein
VKSCGVFFLFAGALTASYFVFRVLGDEEFAKAALLAERNPGHMLYEARLGAASVRRGFAFGGVGAGLLLALNGGTLFLIGRVAEKSTASGGARRLE